MGGYNSESIFFFLLKLFCLIQHIIDLLLFVTNQNLKVKMCSILQNNMF